MVKGKVFIIDMRKRKVRGIWKSLEQEKKVDMVKIHWMYEILIKKQKYICENMPLRFHSVNTWNTPC